MAQGKLLFNGANVPVGAEITGSEVTLPSIAGNANKVLKVNPTGTGTVWGDAGGGGATVETLTLTNENSALTMKDSGGNVVTPTQVIANIKAGHIYLCHINLPLIGMDFYSTVTIGAFVSGDNPITFTESVITGFGVGTNGSDVQYVPFVYGTGTTWTGLV